MPRVQWRVLRANVFGKLVDVSPRPDMEPAGAGGADEAQVKAALAGPHGERTLLTTGEAPMLSQVKWKEWNGQVWRTAIRRLRVVSIAMAMPTGFSFRLVAGYHPQLKALTVEGLIDKMDTSCGNEWCDAEGLFQVSQGVKQSLWIHAGDKCLKQDGWSVPT